MYDVVILAIGFGLEAFLEGETPSYWSPSQLSAPLLTNLPEPLIFVSGNGDGGLVDFLMAAFDAKEHQAICELVLGLDLGPALAVLQRIEQEVWAAGGEDLDLLALYSDRVHPLVPNSVWHAIIPALRPNARIHLHTDQARLFKRTTSLHNRLAAFLVIKADQAFSRNLIQVSTGVAFVGAVPVTGEITLQGSPAFTPYRRFLRLGPDSLPNLEPFKAMLATFPSRIRASATRPESPQLTPAARARFESLAPAGTASAVAPPVAPLGVVATANYLLIRSAGAHLEWLSEIGPEGAQRFWEDGRSFTVAEGVSAGASRNFSYAQVGGYF